MKFKILILCIATIMFLFNCSSDSNNDLSPDPDPDPSAKVTYADDIQSIMTNNCTNCHGNPPTQSAPFSLTIYNDFKARVNAIISRINNASNPMPPTGIMPKNLRDMVQQ